MKTSFNILSFVAGLTLISAAYAHDELSEGKNTETIVIAQASVIPEAEVRQAAEMDANGPRKTTGIKALRILGTVPLAGEYERPDERVLRGGRKIDIEPGGLVAVHRHDGRPGIAYIVSGQLTEHRVSVDMPVVKKAGDAV